MSITRVTANGKCFWRCGDFWFCRRRDAVRFQRWFVRLMERYVRDFEQAERTLENLHAGIVHLPRRSGEV